MITSRIMKSWLLTVLLGIGVVGGVFAQQPNTDTEEVIIAFKTHFDIGYTDLAATVVKKYQTTMIESALEAVDQSRQQPAGEHFIWTMPSWPMKAVLEGCNPKIKPRVEQALKDGYFAIHALPLTFETEASDPEMLVRSLEFSSNIAKQYGLALPIDAKMTDVPEHSWILPTLLSNAGIKFLHLGCNPASMSPDVPVLFWWEGPDGSRLLTMYWEKYYGTDVVPPANWPYKSWLALIHTNDNQGPPSPEEVQQTIDEVKRLNPNARVRLGRMSDFYDLIMAEKADIPVVKADMPDTWIHGYMSMPKEMALSRQLHKDVFTLEALNSQLNIWKEQHHDITSVIDQSVESSILFDEHTFGLAISHGQAGDWCYGDEFNARRAQGVYDPIELSWNEKSDRIKLVDRLVTPELHGQIQALANAVDTEEPHITVYNPLPYKRSGIIELRSLSGNIKNKYLQDPETGEVIPFSNQGNVMRFWASDVPSMGYKTYLPVDITPSSKEQLLHTTPSSNLLENAYLKVTIDPVKGGLQSVIDKTTGREMVDQKSEYAFGAFLYERFSKEMTDQYAKDYIKAGWHWAYAELGRPKLSDAPYQRVMPTPDHITYENDGIKASAILHYKKDDANPHDYTIIFSLVADSPELQVNLGIQGKSPEPWPEAGWMAFPFNVANASFKVGRLGAVTDPTQDFIRGANHDYCFLNSGLAIIDDTQKGYGITSPDVPAISLDRPGLWKYSSDFTPSRPNVFFNLYNNQWSTNFTEWIEGSWRASFKLWPITDYNHEQALISPSEENRTPLIAAFSNQSDRTIPIAQQGIDVSMKGVAVTAFRQHPDQKGFELRLWEQAGNNGKCTVTLPSGLQASTATPVNLRGETTGKPIKIKNGAFKLHIAPWAPYSFIIN
ncbi:hypothetical protein DMA11_00925 [Marinilabiliaceae bacterium JC017]|nr:hypothetical protein DMA11_00925 [Marinilabiliaceae bacterium JC017]